MTAGKESTCRRVYAYVNPISRDIHAGYLHFYASRGKPAPVVASCLLEDYDGYVTWALKYCPQFAGEAGIPVDFSD